MAKRNYEEMNLEGHVQELLNTFVEQTRLEMRPLEELKNEIVTEEDIEISVNKYQQHTNKNVSLKFNYSI